MTAAPRAGLIERGRACLAVVDVQQHFLDKLPAGEAAPLVARIGWLMRVAAALGVPVIATAEDVAALGPMVADLEALMPEGAPPGRGKTAFDKAVFGLAGQPDIRAAVEGTGRDTVVLTGLETDVCIAQSALGLQQAGFRAVVVDDACASPPPHHDHGLRRLRDAGVTVTSVKGLFYEWCRDVPTANALGELTRGPLPPGLTL